MGAGGGSRLFWGWWARCAGSSSCCGCWVAVVVGVVLGVSRLASAGGPMGDFHFIFSFLNIYTGYKISVKDNCFTN